MNKDTQIISKFGIEESDKVWTPEAKWTIPHKSNEKSVFLFPSFGPGTYDEVVRQVMENKDNGANLPTGEQSAFMLDEAYNSEDEAVSKSPRTEFVRKKIMRNGWLWIPQVNIWTPKSDKNPGMYSVFDENGKGLNIRCSIDELEDRLSGGDTERGVRFSQDRSVAFAPLNTMRAGYHEKGTLSSDGAFIAVYGVEGAEALDRVSKNFSFKPYSWIINNDSDKPIKTLPALDRYRNLDNNRLYASFNAGSDYGDGYVLSVSGLKDSAEGTEHKN